MVEMSVKVVESVVVAHQFETKMVALIVGFSLEQLLPSHKQL